MEKNPHTPKFVKGFVVGASSGSTELVGLFPGKNVAISHAFKGFVQAIGIRYSSRSFACGIFQTLHNGNKDDLIIETLRLSERGFVGSNEVCAILAYLGSKSGNALLDIPNGQEQVNIILGYIHGLVLVAKNEANEIYLYTRPLNSWGKLTPMLIEIAP